MANILLISGAVSGDKRYGKLEKVGAYLPPYGLLSVAASLEKAGHAVNLIDREVLPLSNQEILNYIKLHRPDLVGADSLPTNRSTQPLTIPSPIIPGSQGSEGYHLMRQHGMDIPDLLRHQTLFLKSIA